MDAQQILFMNTELCILVDENDQILGGDTKKNCHLMENINRGVALHRAFSIFLFDEEGRLLLQQRATEKITFPDCWTNTVCSHPLFNLPDEKDGVAGVKIAAQRKLTQELGIPAEEVPLEAFHCVTRILYKAPSDGMWVDYILFVQRSKVSVKVNPNEVRDYKFVTMEELEGMIQEATHGKLQITPWFRLIYNNLLTQWWKQLLQKAPVPQDNVIHHL